MTQFEFLMMIASVVVAVGMTEIVGGWGRLARADGEIKFDWLHLGWTIYILLLSVQYWIGMWSYRELRIEYVGQIFFLVVPTLFLVLSAFAMSPDVVNRSQIDMRTYYLEKRRVVFLSLAVFSLAAWLADIVIVGYERLEVSFMLFSIVSGLVLCALAYSQRVWLHGAVLVFLIGSVIAYFFSHVAVQDQRWLG
ncbi:MAG: hypothetical protein QNL15_09130 [Pseudomonadales bacterium]|jgi:hypothetical protein|tara:strand:- start:1548 stop:2129 length:582 start_codon:yes stop_codon:yes gene_type:complete